MRQFGALVCHSANIRPPVTSLVMFLLDFILAALGLHCSTGASLIVTQGLLIVECGLQSPECGLSSSGSGSLAVMRGSLVVVGKFGCPTACGILVP